MRYLQGGLEKVVENDVVATIIAFWIAFVLLLVSLGCPNLRSVWLVDMGLSAVVLVLDHYLEPAWPSALVVVLQYVLLFVGLYLVYVYGCFGVP